MVTTHAGGAKGAQGSLERLDVAFDEERAVANAGLLLPATLAGRLGLERLADELVDLGAAGGGAPGAQGPDDGPRDAGRRQLHR